MKFPRIKRKRPKKGVMKYIFKRRKSGPLHFTLIDPDKQEPKEAAERACLAERSGSDAIMVGGSHAAQAMFLNDTIQAIKDKCDLPVILFPSGHSGVSPHADAVFFMSLLNSRSAQYLIEEQIKGAVLVDSYRIEPLGMGYVLVESGNVTSVGFEGDVRPLPRDKPEFVVGYTLAAKYFGMKMLYLEAGSGAHKPVPNDMIAMAKKTMGKEMLLIVGGGICDQKTALDKVRSGADIIVTGTIAERDFKACEAIIRAIKR